MKSQLDNDQLDMTAIVAKGLQANIEHFANSGRTGNAYIKLELADLESINSKEILSYINLPTNVKDIKCVIDSEMIITFEVF